jgi:anti-sigma-K factor RskA
MKRAFVVTLELDTSDDLTVAEDLAEIISDEGYDVVSVNPHGGDAATVTPEGPVVPENNQLF